jgi:hypothetical protein
VGIPLRSITSTEENTMSKTQNSKKLSRKAPLKTAKEKRQAKQAKKARG